MAKNKLSDLRDHLFETLERLKDDEKPMEIERARAVSQVAQTMINLAKVEVDMVRATDGRAMAGAFFSTEGETRALPAGAAPTKEPLSMARLKAASS